MKSIFLELERLAVDPLVEHGVLQRMQEAVAVARVELAAPSATVCFIVAPPLPSLRAVHMREAA